MRSEVSTALKMCIFILCFAACVDVKAINTILEEHNANHSYNGGDTFLQNKGYILQVYIASHCKLPQSTIDIFHMQQKKGLMNLDILRQGKCKNLWQIFSQYFNSSLQIVIQLMLHTH
jgi:hypothetical protein